MAVSGLAYATPVRAEETENAATETESAVTESTETESADTDSTATENAYSYEGDGYAVTYTIVNSWNDGYTAEVSIKNTGDKKIHNWNLMFSLNGEIANIWNAKISSRNDNGVYTVEGEEYNSNINPDSEISFGFNASGRTEIPELHFSQSIQMPVEEGNFEVDYAVSDDWETGIVGEIGILNKSSKAFKDWCIAFDWENDIDNIWNAKIISHEDSHYVISCEEYNRSIEAGERVRFGFSCQTKKSSSQPENITVTHYTAGDEENGDGDDEEEEIDPSEVTEYADIEYQDGNCAESVLDDVRFVNYAPELLDVTWVSSDESAMTNEGHVIRGQEDRTVTVTANIQYKGKDYRKEFVLTVKRITDIDVSALKDYSLSQLDEMNKGDEDYETEVNDYRYLESVYGTYSDVKVDSYETALVSLYNIKSAIGISNPFEELQITEVYADEFGYTFIFDQKYKGVEVLNYGITVSSDKNGITNYFDSSYFPLFNDLSVIPQSSWEEAVQSAALCGYVTMGEEEGTLHEPVIFNEFGKGTLVWNLHCQEDNDSSGKMYEVFVDAQTGEALFAYEVSCNYVGTGEDMNESYKIFPVELRVENGKVKYSLEDSTRKIKIYNENLSRPITKNVNKWKPEEVSAMTNMRDIYDYYKEEFGRKSYDGNGGEIRVSLQPSLKNQASRAKDKNDRIYFCVGNGSKGNGVFKEQSLVAEKDVLAHEFTHAVNSYNSLIGNKGVMGIVNEAYADIMACYVDGNWRMGEDVAVAKRGCIRNIAEPLKSHCATKVGGLFYIEGGDSHENSTVISHIAYRMENIELSVESKKIWYKSLLKNKKGWTDFWKVYKTVDNAAKKMGCSEKQCKKIKQFFEDAGIKKSTCKKSSAYYREQDKAARINLKKSSSDRKIQITGKIVEADKDFNFSNNVAMDSVRIKDASGKEMAKTDRSGNYHADVENANPIVMHFGKDGYLDETMYLVSESIAGQDIRYCDIVELIPEADKGKGKAEGYIRDSVSGNGIKDLKISVRKGINNIYTNPEATIESKQDGYYITPELEAGNYCLEISSEDEEYMSTYFNIKVFGGMTFKAQNMSISDSLEDNQMRVVLTWGEKPRDLDSHLLYSLSNGNEGHIYYGDRENVLNNVCIAKLDVDDTDGYGPETTTIYDDETGDYTFYVDNYSGESELGNGNAMVKVYLGNQAVPSYTFTVPEGKGDIWTVFKYNSAVGRLSVVNELGDIVKR